MKAPNQSKEGGGMEKIVKKEKLANTRLEEHITKF